MPCIPAPHFSLRHTLESGQCFRWRQLPDGWHLCLEREKAFLVRQDGDTLAYRGASRAFIKNYFGLDGTFDRVLAALGADPLLAPAIRHCRGLRILGQDPWECTVAFLCSQISNIKKIRLNMGRIAEMFGTPLAFEGRMLHAFPAPGAIGDREKLGRCAVGFRANYILAASAMLTDAKLARIGRMSYERAKEKLLEVPGIGTKVADCILLFAFGKGEAFPVDVWMERVLREIHFKHRDVSLAQMAEFGRQRWGTLAGYAQQYLYHWSRTRA
jgi:N-glycosylase/DNA lyase